jgi:branched-chain amino acid transport system substrate-binding protein
MAEAMIGVLFDNDVGDMRTLMVDAVKSGIGQSGVHGNLSVVSAQPRGLPSGTEWAFRRGFHELADAGVLAIIGPGITDNGFVARELAGSVGLPCVIWAAHEELRSYWSFHFQIGSLEEEAPLLVDHLVSRGIDRVALVSDRATIIDRYVDWFDYYAARAGLDVVARTVVWPDLEDGKAPVDVVRRSDAQALVYFGLGRSVLPLALALQEVGWDRPVVGNSALLVGYGSPAIASACEGWVYVDLTSESNPLFTGAATRLAPEVLRSPLGVCFYDMGRLVGEALARAPYLTRAGVRAGFERVKRLPASVGYPGTTMTLGCWDRAILKGQYLVLRQWHNGRSVEFAVA